MRTDDRPLNEKPLMKRLCIFISGFLIKLSGGNYPKEKTILFGEVSLLWLKNYRKLFIFTLSSRLRRDWCGRHGVSARLRI